MDSNRKLLAWLVTTLALALAYVACGLLGLQLTIPPNYASPLYPAAGLALVGLVSLGLRHAPGVALGALVVNLISMHAHGLPPSLLAPLLMSVGAMLQALVGAWAVRRWVARPLQLSEPRDLARFFLLGAGLACVISPTVGVATLLLTGVIGLPQAPSDWAAWWMGDTMGVLIAAPIVLTLIGRPRKIWAPRRLSVGLPMLLTTVLMALGTVAVTEWDAQRARSNFERDAVSAANNLEAMLREPLMALQAARSLLLLAPTLSRAEFERATVDYLQAGGPLLAVGVARRVARAQLPAFDQAARAEGLDGFTARDRQRPGDVPTPADEDLLAIRLIEPLARNASALGVNIRSIPVARRAVEQALVSATAAATAGFPLSQDAPSGPAIGVVVYQAFYAGNPAGPAERLGAAQGVVFATVRPDQLLQAVAPTMPDYLALCLVETDPQAANRRLAGPAGCEALPSRLPVKLRQVDFGGRDWAIRVYAPNGYPPDEARSWPFALVGLLMTGLLGMLLLLVTGRARRIEDLVLARTAELKREVTEREHGELALRESEQRLRNILDNAPVGILFADLNGQFQEINPYFCRLVERSAAELLRLHTFDISHPDDAEEDLRLARSLLRGEIGLYQRHKRYLTPAGREVQVRGVVSLLRDSEGRPHRIVGVVEDIGDQLKMQALERARESAEAANQAKNDFLSRMSHELRTPLNAMLGFTQLLDLDSIERLSERQRGRTAQIQRAGWHLLEMINDTLDLSRIESGALKLDIARQSLAQLLDEAQALVEGDARMRGLQLSRTLGERARFVLGDATRVKQVLINLLSNAVKYNVEGGSIAISSRRVDEQVVELVVSDSGLGLSPEQLAALFQPFNRLGREHSNTAGTGIGLVISKRLAELMGGDLGASSGGIGHERGGASFVLRLPAADAGQAPLSTPEAVPVPVYAGQRRLVYIEDNEVNAEVMRGVLEQRPQIALQVCSTGQAGLAALRAAPPDLLILDMQLPDMDGLAVLQHLLADAAPVPGLVFPVVVVSANALPDQILACHAAGVRHYLTKPIDVRELLALLDQLLEETPPPGS